MPRLVILSDTHNYHHRLPVPEGDILIHCGDFTSQGRPSEVTNFLDWFLNHNHSHKILIAGNHDLSFQTKDPEAIQEWVSPAIYLEDSGVELFGLKFWGSPWQPYFGGWAYNLQRGAEIARMWSLIPKDTQVLVTHTPPYGILDMTVDVLGSKHVGCEELTKTIQTLPDLKLHCFGHIHHNYAQEKHGHTLFVNAALEGGEQRKGGGQFKILYPPQVVDL